MNHPIREYRHEPCPVCGHRNWCGRREDGLVLCRRPPTPREVSGLIFKGMARDGATGMYVEADRAYPRPRGPSRRVNREKPPENPPTRSKAGRLAEDYPSLVAQLTDEHRLLLAEHLGLPGAALDPLAIGWWPDRRWWNPESEQYEGEPGCWTFPECDARGRIIGIGLRWPAGHKGQLAGGRRGLTLPTGWRGLPDPVLVVEGPSDVLAGRSIGLNVIGRPSNSGGAELLAQACRDRRVLVVGEHDRKADSRWPGKEGAEAVAEKLTDAWGWPVPAILPPDEAKDLRGWVLAQRADFDRAPDATDRHQLGARFLEVVAPPEILLHARARTRRGAKVAVRVFRWSDVPDGPLYTDKLDLDCARARRKFAETVAQCDPAIDVEALQERLLHLEVPERVARPKVPDAERPPTTPGLPVSERSSEGRPQIQGNERQLRDIRADALAALLASNDPPRLFIRSGGIARVALVQDDQDRAVPEVQQLDAHALRGALTDAADWFTLHHSKERGDYLLPDLPPMAVARDILALTAIDLPPLAAIITCPTFAADGNLIVNGGYDRGSGLWHHPTLTDLPAIPERPSRDDAIAARSALADIIAEFPFVDEASRANTLALLLLPFVRPLIDGPTPLYAVDAPTPGTGKGLLVQASLWPSLGYSLDIRSGARDPDEWRKRITAELLPGKPVIGFDNATTRLDSEHLAAALTATLWTDRVLGQTRVVTVPNRAVWVCTGNNLAFSKELARRVAWIRLDARIETPEQRTGFRYPNLTAHVREQRTALVAAALTLGRSWLAAGRPRGRQVMGSFESYAETLGGILDVAGVEGFLANADALRRQADTETSEWRAFVHAWWERWQDAWVGVSDLSELLWSDGQRSDLLTTVVRSETQRGAVTQLGMRLARKRDCIIGARRILVDANEGNHGRLAYRLVPVDQETSGPDEKGLPKVSPKVSAGKLSSGTNLRPEGDLGRPSGRTPSYPCANKHAPASTYGALNSPGPTRRMQKRSPKVSSSPQPLQTQGLTPGDLEGDLEGDLGETLLGAGKGLPQGNGPTATSDRVPAEWTTPGWIRRLRQLADCCERIQPDLAAQHRAKAQRLENRAVLR